MPTTFVGLLIFVIFLTPGFLYTTQRRALVPASERSVLMESTSIVSISLVTNSFVAACFILLRQLLSDHTPDISNLLRPRSSYWLDHLAYVLGWGALLLTISCTVAVVAARWARLRSVSARIFAPVVVDSSAWCETFVADPGYYPHAGVQLASGEFISGRITWFSTSLDESGDRELVLGQPLQIKTHEGVTEVFAEKVIIAAREVRCVYVTPVRDHASPQ